jgi:UDP-2,3-diacylglucosamine pyrophosphatase LpxH
MQEAPGGWQTMTFQLARNALFGLAVSFNVIALNGTAVSQVQAPPEAQAVDTVAQVPYKPPAAEERYFVFISDLHFGVGRWPDSSWNPTEDFRWPRALEGFLKQISVDGHERVDLVIVGDFLELWQPPPDIECKGSGANLGCTLEEMEKLSRLVAAAHAQELAILRAFAERGENRLHLIPGNHDSTLRYERVWRPVGDALRAENGRIELVTGGIWNSPGGRIVAEHGHQIGLDVNGYETWPDILQRQDQVDYVVRPWGELFVQKLFNEQEKVYEIIDNLSPEAAGAKIRAADRGFWKSAADIARFVSFNLWETSPKQKVIALGPDDSGKQEWNLHVARNLGSDLFVNALAVDDPLRLQLVTKGVDADAIKAELAALARDPARLPDESVLHLCDLIADNGKTPCVDRQLGALGQHTLIAKDKILARHLRNRRQTFSDVRTFIYGHTHQYEIARKVDLSRLLNVVVANTGAFQRLIDEPGFRRRLDGRSPEQGLREMKLEELAPCYGVIIMKDENAPPLVQVWFMPEDGVGEFVLQTDAKCK